MKRILIPILLAYLTAFAPANAEITGAQKIANLINSIELIANRLQLSQNLSIGAVGYSTVGGVVVDDALSSAEISEALFTAYMEAKAAVLEHDYATATSAEQLFMQEHNAHMVSLSNAVDDLVDATNVLLTATSIAEVAMDADTRPEQVALQEMMETDEYSIQLEEVTEYNESLVAVETYAQQAGAFLAAANNKDITGSIDSYAVQNNVMVGAYTAITYTQSIDEFVITWDGNGTGWSGYLNDSMVDAGDLYSVSQYVLQHGHMPMPVPVPVISPDG